MENVSYAARFRYLDADDVDDAVVDYDGLNVYGPDGHKIGDVIDADGLIGILRGLPDGITELGCHPGTGDEAPGMYREERERETRALCDPDATVSDPAGKTPSSDFTAERNALNETSLR